MLSDVITVKECDARGVAFYSAAWLIKCLFFFEPGCKISWHPILVASHSSAFIAICVRSLAQQWFRQCYTGFYLKRTFYFFFFKSLNDIAHFQVVVVLNGKTALHIRSHIFNIVFVTF